MTGRAVRLGCALLLVLGVPARAQDDGGRPLQRRRPAQVGVDSTRLAEAIRFALDHEARAPRDQAEAQRRTFGREPYGGITGPMAPRGAPSGVVIRRGAVIATWGDPAAVEMTHSVTKSFLSTVVGLAVDRGLIRSTDDPVAEAVGAVQRFRPSPSAAVGGGAALPAPEHALAGLPRDPADTGAWLAPFASRHNRTLTWDHLLRQVSDWEGTLWGKPEWADRPDADTAKWRTRPRRPPGSTWEYNDVRVNALALAATVVWGRPLPAVLDSLVMRPIGASRTWRWTGYDDAWVVLDGRPAHVVSGGGHWGGGLFISAWDMARFGLLTLRGGVWQGRRVLSERHVRAARTPTPANPGYGYMNWFLNTDRRALPSAPASAWWHLGNGANVIYCDPEHDLVVVARWLESRALDGLVGRVLAAIER